MGKNLYYLMKNNKKYGELLYSKAGFCWVLTNLKGGNADFSTYFDKWGTERQSYKQWRALYAVTMSRDYTMADYTRIVADMLDMA